MPLSQMHLTEFLFGRRAEMHPMYPPARPSAQSRRDLAEIRLRDHLRQAHHAERRVQPAAVGRDVDHGLEDAQRLRGGEAMVTSALHGITASFSDTA